MIDIIGIGLGPFNLSLAALLKNKDCSLSSKFFESKPRFNWHEGMLMLNTTLQVPFLADLVTMVDPTSQFSFLNYLVRKQKVFQFYFRESFFLPRLEYNDYCQWVCEQLDNLSFNHTVEDIIPVNGGFKVTVNAAGDRKFYECRNLVIGVGTIPSVPKHVEKFCQEFPAQCFHSSKFMNLYESLPKEDTKKIVLVGSGQSAGEIFYKLLSDKQTNHVSWVTRAQSFLPMEYTPLGLEHFSPDYMDYFYHLPIERKSQVLKQQGLLYKGINAQLLKSIYDLLYQKSIVGKDKQFKLMPNLTLDTIEYKKIKHTSLLSFQCNFSHNYLGHPICLDADYLILATGYQNYKPDFLSNLNPYIEHDTQGNYHVERDYSLRYKHHDEGKIFVQNMEFHSHGVGTPDLGLGAYRAATIINTIAKKTIYPLSHNNAFQMFC